MQYNWSVQSTQKMKQDSFWKFATQWFKKNMQAAKEKITLLKLSAWSFAPKSNTEMLT